jgi:hypothetical protein
MLHDQVDGFVVLETNLELGDRDRGVACNEFECSRSIE